MPGKYFYADDTGIIAARGGSSSTIFLLQACIDAKAVRVIKPGLMQGYSGKPIPLTLDLIRHAKAVAFVYMEIILLLLSFLLSLLLFATRQSLVSDQVWKFRLQLVYST